MRGKVILTLAAALILAVACTTAVAAADGWLRTNSGALVWITGLQAGDSATWTGGHNGQDRADGQGSMQYYSKGKLAYAYDGTMKNGKYNGTGTMNWAGGHSYSGDYVDGVRVGKGTMRWASGNVYEGDWANGAANGKGLIKFPNGNSFEGDFANGQMNGKGVYRFANGYRYEGDVVDGAFHGYGVAYDPSGKVVQKGRWQNGKFVG